MSAAKTRLTSSCLAIFRVDLHLTHVSITNYSTVCLQSFSIFFKTQKYKKCMLVLEINGQKRLLEPQHCYKTIIIQTICD